MPRNEDRELDLIQDEIAALAKPAHARKSGKKTIRVRSSVEVARDNFKLAKATHRKAVKAIRQDIRRKKAIARNNIAAHKTLIRQARTSYNASKVNQK